LYPSPDKQTYQLQHVQLPLRNQSCFAVSYAGAQRVNHSSPPCAQVQVPWSRAAGSSSHGSLSDSGSLLCSSWVHMYSRLA
jgi:hypothetical protein